MPTYGPGIDQLQHAKSVSHITNNKFILLYSAKYFCCFYLY